MFVAVEAEAGESVGPRRIASELDVLICSRQVAELARICGLTRSDVWAIEIAVRELGTNIVKYAGTGTLVARSCMAPRGVVIVVEDDGPGIRDIAKAMVDGFTDGRMVGEDLMPWPARGLGNGLGAVNRMMDHFQVENRPEGGLRVTAFKAAVHGRGK